MYMACIIRSEAKAKIILFYLYKENQPQAHSKSPIRNNERT